MNPELFANHKYPIMNVKQFPHTSGTQWQTQSNESGKITENLSASFKNRLSLGKTRLGDSKLEASVWRISAIEKLAI